MGFFFPFFSLQFIFILLTYKVFNIHMDKSKKFKYKTGSGYFYLLKNIKHTSTWYKTPQESHKDSTSLAH